jgi:hypothetical protein
MLFCFTHYYYYSHFTGKHACIQSILANSDTQAAADERFFIIKSWNMQNVIDAQRDGVWATQEKNTRLFTDAFHTCRSVLLLFSVNKSMAFQGAVSNLVFFPTHCTADLNNP